MSEPSRQGPKEVSTNFDVFLAKKPPLDEDLQDAIVLLTAICKWAISDYVKLKPLKKRTRVKEQIFKTAESFIFNDSHVIDWGDMQLSTREICEIIGLGSVERLRKMAKERLEDSIRQNAAYDVYLSGPIESYGGKYPYREKLREILDDENLTYFDPAEIQQPSPTLSANIENCGSRSHRDIDRVVTICEEALKRSDILILYYDATHTVGTYAEMELAHLQKKPIIVLLKGRRRVPIWLYRRASKIIRWSDRGRLGNEIRTLLPRGTRR